MRADVLVIGGGAIGAGIACFLRRWANPPRVVMIERDPTYTQASTPRASGGLRRLFSGPENIALSNFSIPFYERFREEVSADIDFRKGGYLFIVPETGRATLNRNTEVQQSHGVRVELLTSRELKARFPSMRVEDIAVAAYSPEDGWVDPHSVL